MKRANSSGAKGGVSAPPVKLQHIEHFAATDGSGLLK